MAVHCDLHKQAGLLTHSRRLNPYDVLTWETEISYIKEYKFKFCHCSVPIYQAICMVTDINVRWQWWLKNNMLLINSQRYLHISQYNSL